MKKGEVINGYQILRDFTTAGGGLSKWTFARKGSEEFFFKEFLAPTYPTDDSPGSPKTKEAKRKRCAAFEAHQKSVIESLKGKCARGGNVVFARDFFRAGTKYYKVTDKVDVASMDVDAIARLPIENRILIMKTVAHSLGVLHKCGIVHGDLKPNNLLIKRSAHGGDTYIAKLIDFDSAFFSGEPPEIADELVGDLVFYSPEAARYVREDKAVKPGDLQLSCDIFALGIIYCLYLTGEQPVFNQKKHQYACTAAINGERIHIKPKSVPDKLAQIVNEMLQTEASARPSVGEVFERLKTLDRTSAPSPAPSATPSGSAVPVSAGGGLRGTLMKKSAAPRAVASGSAAEAPKPGTSTPSTPPAPTDAESTLSPAPEGSKLRGKLIRREGA